jgi:hypothetical protein
MPTLFDPLRVGNIELDNRIIMAPMTRSRANDEGIVDYNWDVSKGCPSFVSEPPGDQVRREPEKLRDVKAYVRNVAQWLA